MSESLEEIAMSLRAEVETTLSSLKLGAEDAAAVGLVREYADALDSGTADLSDLGPKLLTALNALLATPAARGRQKKGGDSDVSDLPNPLSLIRGQG